MPAPLPAPATISPRMKKSTVPLAPPEAPVNSSVAQWCRFAHECLANLQWQHAGFEIFDDGSPNTQKPLHRCPYCWVYRDSIRTSPHHSDCMIHLALQSFTRSVDDHVQTLASSPTSLLSPSSRSCGGGGGNGIDVSRSLTPSSTASSSGAAFVAASGVSAGAANDAIIPSFSRPNVTIKAEDDVIMEDMPSIGASPASSTTGMLPPSLFAPTLARQVSLGYGNGGGNGSGNGNGSGVGAGRGGGNLGPSVADPLPPTSSLSLAKDPSFSMGPGLARDPSFLKAGDPAFFRDPSFLNLKEQSMDMPMDYTSGLRWQASSSSMFIDTAPMVTGGAPLSSGLSASPREHDVVAILAARSHAAHPVATASPGFPAFDAQNRCAGFYVYEEPGGASRLRFVPLEETSMKNQEESLRAEYLEAKKMQPHNESALITKDAFVELERMKEQALLRHFKQFSDQPSRSVLV